MSNEKTLLQQKWMDFFQELINFNRLLCFFISHHHHDHHLQQILSCFQMVMLNRYHGATLSPLILAQTSYLRNNLNKMISNDKISHKT